jgi:hypothetical protein
LKDYGEKEMFIKQAALRLLLESYVFACNFEVKSILNYANFDC